MYRLHTPERPYTDPWLLPLADRLRLLAGAHQRVAYYYEEPNNSTFRYRAWNMAQVLNDGPDPAVRASWFHRADLTALDTLVEHADRLVICRSGYEHHVAGLIERFRTHGKPVFFDVDDFVFDTDYVHLIVDNLALDKNDPRVWDDWFGMIGRMGRTLRACDAAITTNAFLATRIAAFTGRPVAVVPNFMNREQLAMSDAVWADKAASGFARDGRLTLGYFSGSPSHRLDYAIVEPALEALLDAHPQLDVLTVGYIEPGPALQRFGGRVKRAPFHDWVNLQRLVGSVEVNLMPLQANLFTDCKSPLKYFEAAAVGTLSMASPSANYADAIRDGVTGVLARAHEWQRRLDAWLRSFEALGPMRERARADALARYAWTGQREAILRALRLG